MKKTICILILFPIFFNGYCSDEKSITLTGSIIEKSFYGPPNFGETPKDDRIEKYFFLLLNKPILYNYKDQYIFIKDRNWASSYRFYFNRQKFLLTLFVGNIYPVCKRETLLIKQLLLTLNMESRNAKDVLCIFVALYCVMPR